MFGHKSWEPTTEPMPNMVVYEWASILANALANPANKTMMGMYLEFENVENVGDPVDVPDFGRDRTIQYYNDLQSSTVRNYLRVPLTSALIGSTSDDFPKGNSVTFFARSQGLNGVNGIPFSDAYNSVIFGAALVAFGDATDFTRDLIFSAFYFPTTPVNQQQPKLATSQVGLGWKISLM